MSVSSDVQQIDDLVTENYATFDPSILAGYESIFNREINIQFYYPNIDEPDKRIVRIRILEKQEGSSLEEIRMEISSEADISFLLESVIGSEQFSSLQSMNRLRIEFSKFSRSVAELLEKSVTAPTEYEVKFEQREDYGGRLVFMQKLRLRQVEVFSIEFVLADDDLVRNQAQHRFNKLRMELAQKSNEYEQQMQRLEKKNPSLARNIRKSVEFAVQQRIIQEVTDTR